MWRWRQRFTSLVCLSSLVSLFFTSVIFSSSSKSLFPHFIDPSTLTVCTHATYETLNSLSIVFYRSHSPYKRHTRPRQNLNGLSTVFYRSHSPYTRRMRPWQNLNGLSTVFYRSHSPYTRRTKPWETSASVGLAQARPNKFLNICDAILQLSDF